MAAAINDEIQSVLIRMKGRLNAATTTAHPLKPNHRFIKWLCAPQVAVRLMDEIYIV